MKHLLIGIMLCIAALGAKAESLYDACENITGISTTYVSKVLLGAAQNQVYMYPQGMSLNRIVGKLDGIQVLEGEKKAATALRDKARPLLDKGGYDLLLRNRDEGEVSEILFRKLGNGRSECVVYDYDPDDGGELNIVIFTGTFTLQDLTLQGATAKERLDAKRL